MEQLLSIGAKVDKESIEEVSSHIIKVLNTSAGDAVKIAAVNAIASALKVDNVTVSNCNFANTSN